MRCFRHACWNGKLEAQLRPATHKPVIPAKAGIHLAFGFAEALWIPAFAGMTAWCGAAF